MPVPSRNWFPASLSERATWFQNFATQFAILAPTLNFDAGQVLSVENDNETVQWLAEVAVMVDHYEKAMTAYRKEMLEGPNFAPNVTLPVPPVYPVPGPPSDPGIFIRLIELVDRIRVAGNYSTDDGEALGIIPSKPADLIPNELQPDPSLTALPGNVIEVAFKRGKTEGIDVEIEVDNSGTWEHSGKFFKSPGEIVIPQNTQATARSVKLRARYLLDNKPVGQYSEIDQISTIP